MLKKSVDARNNTGYHGITLQKIGKNKAAPYITVMVNYSHRKKQHRRQFAIDKYGLEDALRLAAIQLQIWSSGKCHMQSLNSLDCTKAREWLEHNQVSKMPKTNTGIKAIRITRRRRHYEVIATWIDRVTKKHTTKYASLQKRSYRQALEIVMKARYDGMGIPMPKIDENMCAPGLAWLQKNQNDNGEKVV
jgi:hypothetical protein